MPGPPFGRQQLAGLNGWGRASRPGPGRGRGSLLFISGLTCHFLVLFVELKGGCFPRLPPDGRDTWPVPVLCLPCLALGSFGGRAPGFGLPRCLLRPLAAPGLWRMAPEAPGGGSRPAGPERFASARPRGFHGGARWALSTPEAGTGGETEAWRAGAEAGLCRLPHAEPVFSHCYGAFQLFVSFFL